ncbi:MAG: PilZ domain-containing protein [Anaerolineaceae bacterium]|nr:MAG: PilZ domain-containing protein [Anaerolineaceae bacterium]
MPIDEIPNGSNVELEVRYSGRSVSFNSEVLLIIHNSILISPIIVNEQTIGFNDNCRVNLIVKIEGKVYLWDNVTVKLVKYDGVIYHKIDVSGDGKPYNRREAYRMYIGEDMPVYINTNSGPLALSVLVKDISETGVGFITKEDLDTNRTIRLKLKDNNSVISLSGIIIRKEFLTHLDSFLYGCKFNEKNNRLGNYIARKQGEELRKKTNNYSSPPAARGKSKSKNKK